MAIKINSSNEAVFTKYQRTNDETYFVLIHARLAGKVRRFLERFLPQGSNNLIDGLSFAVFADLRNVKTEIECVEGWLYSATERFARAA